MDVQRALIGTRLANGAHIYLPDVEAAMRTHSSVVKSAEEARRSGDAVKGVEGQSVLTPCLDAVDGIPVDYMHAVLEGLTRRLLRAWFESSNHHEPYYIKQHLTKIDKALLDQCPPHEFSRPPHSIQKHMKYFKASELLSWLLFYSLPLLFGFLPPLYFHHYALLVCAIHILLNDSITNSEILAADEMIGDFLTLLPELYGRSSCTAN